MPVKLRLQRHGRKKRPYYHIVAADGRTPRDGRFIERIGWYDPTKQPALIDVNVDKALEWLHNGAQPTNTVRNILSVAGVMYKKHLMRGVRKGALSEAQADDLFEAWKEKRGKKNKVSMKLYEPPKETLTLEPPVVQTTTEEAKPAAKKEAPKKEEAKPAAKKEAPKKEEAKPAAKEEAPKKEEAKPVAKKEAPKKEEAKPAAKEEVKVAAPEVAPVKEEVAAKVEETTEQASEAVAKAEEATEQALENVDQQLDDLLGDDSMGSVVDEIDAILESSALNIDNVVEEATEKLEDELDIDIDGK